MKIKNPHTKKKYYNQQKTLKLLGRCLIRIYSLFPHIQRDITIRGLLEPYRGPDRKINLSNSDSFTEVNLEQITFCDIVFKEDYKKLRKGLHKLLKKSKQSYYVDPENIDKFFENVDKNLLTSYWSRLIFFTKVGDDYTRRISLSISSTSYSFATIFVQVEASDKFLEEHKELLEKDSDERYMQLQVPFYKKDWFRIRRWGYKNYSKATHKVSVVEDFLLELKWTNARFLSRYIPMYFTSICSLTPSMDIFTLKKKKKNSEWSSPEAYATVGISDVSNLSDSNDKEDIGIIFNFPQKRLLDFNIKLLFDIPSKKEKDMEGNFHLISEEIKYSLLELMAIINLIRDLESRVLKHKAKYDRYAVKKAWKFHKFNKMIELKNELEKDYSYFIRIQRDIDESFYDEVLKKYASVFGSTEENDQESAIKRWIEVTKIKLQNLSNVFEKVKVDLDNQIGFLNTIIDYRRQKRAITIAFLTLIISLLALIVSLKN